MAKPGTPIEQLVKNLNYVCSQMEIHCEVVSKGGACYDPNNLYNSASVVMNLYYQNQGRHYSKCDFGGSGLITVTDPSEFSLSFFFSKQLCNFFFYLTSNPLFFRLWMLQI